MSEAKFTKGEWVADIRVGCCAVYVKELRDEWEQGLHNDGENIYYASFPNIAMKPELKSESVEPIANAHLIKASPKMYHKLVEVEEYLDSIVGEYSYHSAMHEEITELLAKARGEHE